MNQEEVLRIQQLNQERSATKKTKFKTTARTTALKKILKHPLTKFSIPFLGELGSGGILPGCTAYVAWNYFEEKRSGNPNIAEYFTMGIPAAAVDIVGLLSLTGALLFLSYAITFPCLGLLLIWGLFKQNPKGIKTAKIKK